MPESALLDAQDIIAGYGKKQVINGVSLYLNAGEIVAIIGHNGAGKSTLLKAIFGLIPIWAGQIKLEGQPFSSITPRAWLRVGIAYVPQGNRVFTDLTVRENIDIAAAILSTKAARRAGMEGALNMFPSLKSRLKQRAGTLSGGEKQMLALANALVISPRLLLLDEPSLGLAPPLITNALEQIQQISERSKVSAVIVEQKVREVLKIANRVYVLRNGIVSFSGPADELRNETKLQAVYL